MKRETETKKQGAFAAFLAKKDVVFSAKRYGIEAMGAMALGLFGSLLISWVLAMLITCLSYRMKFWRRKLGRLGNEL